MNNIVRKLSIGSLATLPVLAMADGAPSAATVFNSALSDATTAVGTYAAALVGLAAVGVVFMIAVKYVKKIRNAS